MRKRQEAEPMKREQDQGEEGWNVPEQSWSFQRDSSGTLRGVKPLNHSLQCQLHSVGKPWPQVEPDSSVVNFKLGDDA